MIKKELFSFYWNVTERSVFKVSEITLKTRFLAHQIQTFDGYANPITHASCIFKHFLVYVQRN